MIGNCCHDSSRVYYGLGYDLAEAVQRENWSSSKNNWVRMQMTWPLEHVPCGIANEHLEDSSSSSSSFLPQAAPLRIFRAENWDDISYAAMLKKHSRPCLAILFYFAAMMEFVMEPFCHHNSLDKRPFTFTICFLKIKAKQCLVSNQEESSICKIVLVLS